MQPADLGLVPQQTLADALARRFGGYSHDFFVSRVRERDFVIVLPGWVSAEILLRRQIITLESIWLRCFSWGAQQNARPDRSRYTAWIQLRGVPFECWMPARVASMICGFGRFIRADDVSKSMTDMRSYRCRIAVDSIQEIPQRLAIVMGDEIVDIYVHLESWERVNGEGGDLQPPPPPPHIAPDPAAGGDGGRRRGDGREGSVAGGLVEDGGGLVDASEGDRQSEISVNRAPGSATGGLELPPLTVGGTPPATVCVVSEGAGVRGRRSDAPKPRACPKEGRRVPRGSGPSRCTAVVGEHPLGCFHGRGVERAAAVKRRGGRPLLHWRPAGRACTPSGLVCRDVGKRAGGPREELRSGSLAEGALHEERSGVGSARSFALRTRGSRECGLAEAGGPLPEGYVEACVGGIGSVEGSCSVDFCSLVFGARTGAFMMALSFGMGGSRYWSVVGARGVLVAHDSPVWALTWAPSPALHVDPDWKFGAQALGLGLWTRVDPRESPQGGLAADGGPSFVSVCGVDREGLCDTAEGRAAGPDFALACAAGAEGVGDGRRASLGVLATDGAGAQAARCSPRLVLKAASGVLETAVARKARLQDCGSRAAGGRRRLGRSRISELSRTCGVTLCEGEVDSFTEYVSYGL